MVRFLDGPAQGVSLMLRNAPETLRVVRSSAGDWDALDEPGDEPREDETIFVYRRSGPPRGFVHVDRLIKGRRVGQTSVQADYRVAE